MTSCYTVIELVIVNEPVIQECSHDEC